MQAQSLSKAEKIQFLQLMEEKERREAKRKKNVIGLVCPDKGLVKRVKYSNSGWSETSDTPDIYFPLVFERALYSDKRFIAIIGGRGSSKSVSVNDLCLVDAQYNDAKTFCLREYQASIRHSVHSLLKAEIERLKMPGFEVLQNSISYNGKESFEFAGIARNIDSIKSSHGFKRFCVEEAQTISDESLRALTPTARNKPNRGLPGEIGDEVDLDGVSIIFIANPSSSADPFSKRFIVPYLADLERDGYYEDDLHLIIVMNYMHNPWFADSGLEDERRWDYTNLPRALYDHIWLGKFNDSVSSALIMAEWFDACVDAHKKLGFEPRGLRIASHDPSDGKQDAKGYAMRHGSVVLDVQENLSGSVNEGGHWAARIAIAQGVDAYSWDGAGMGAGLAEQNSKDFDGKKVQLSSFIGAESPDFPDAIYKPALKSPVGGQLTNKQAFKNKRAQYHFALRDRVYATYRAVIHKEYIDPDQLISFASEMPLLQKLRAEICRIPIKPNSNGLNELYTKEEMKSKFKMASPNLAESVMQTLRFIPSYQAAPYIPKSIPVMGRK